MRNVPGVAKARPTAQPVTHIAVDLRRILLPAIAITVVLFLALYRLPDYPITWFDEGSHLHVPKTLVRFGVYADYSSDGFRFYGPTVGVGPTVMLPIAAVFRVFGIGLLQARLVMAGYLLLCIYSVFRLADHLGGRRLAWVACGLLVGSESVSLLYYGRQVLGEVPGLTFLASGILIWFLGWEQRRTWKLVAAGLLIGLAMITKYQYLLVVAPMLGVSWIANALYYRAAPHRVFLIPSAVAISLLAAWQAYLVTSLGPATTAENLVLLRKATAGAALAFSPDLMKQAVRHIVSIDAYFGLLLPALAYGLVVALHRNRDGAYWFVLFVAAAANLLWYVVASISWVRYAFPALAIGAVFVARFFHDLTLRYEFRNGAYLIEAIRTGSTVTRQAALRTVLLGWLAVLLLVPIARAGRNIVAPPFNGPKAIGAYLDENVPTDLLIETWEPEMGFLTDHNYHFPPPSVLTAAVAYAWLGGPPPSELYNLPKTGSPAYLLIGPSARSVNLYAEALQSGRYRLLARVGEYELYGLEGEDLAVGGQER